MRQLCLDYLSRFLGKPYLWGGDNPVQGFDCSGLVVEGLKAVGVLPRAGDWSAHALYAQVFERAPRIHLAEGLRPAMLVFWASGEPGHMTHVEMVHTVDAATGRAITIGASGGGSRTLSVADAIASDAYVKLRPVRPGWSAALDPFG